MTIYIGIAIGFSILLALNVGANNSGASLAIAYGAGALTRRRALIFIAIATLAGAAVAGGPVINTIGKGLVPQEVLSSGIELVLIVLILGTIFIAVANMLRIPVATTHAIVCAVAGIGLFTRTLNTPKFIEIATWWLITPIVSFTISYMMGKFLYFKTLKYLTNNFTERVIFRIFALFLTIAGTLVAFAAGANNSANVVGPLVGIGLTVPSTGAMIAGVGMAVGVILLGGRVLETVGKEIAEINLLRAVSVELVAGAIIVFASIKGIPVSLAEIITSGIIGYSCANQGFATALRNRHVVRIAILWLAVPFVTLALSYYLCAFYFNSGLFTRAGAGF